MDLFRKAMLLCLMILLAAACGRKEEVPEPADLPAAETEAETEENKEEERAEEEAETQEEDPLQEPLRVVFFGASNFARWEDLTELFPDVEAVNTAISGSVDQSQLEAAPEAVYAYEPDLVFIQTATNDFARGMTLDQVLETREVYYKSLEENLPDARFVIMSPLPQPGRPDFWEDVKESNAWIHAWCLENDAFDCIDTTDLMMLEEGPEEDSAGDGSFYDRSLFDEDGVHINEKGRAIWEQAIRRYLDQAESRR